MQRVWKCYGIVTPAGYLMLDYVGSTRRQVREKAEGRHGQKWQTLKKSTGWKIVPLSVTKILPEQRSR